jgi:hypothetical protein
VWTALLEMNMRGKRSVRLVVSSRMDLGGGLGGADQIHLEPLPAADAQQLLLMHGGQEVEWEDGHAAQLVEMCGGNALALTLVGGLLAARRCTPKVRGERLLLNSIRCAASSWLGCQVWWGLAHGTQADLENADTCTEPVLVVSGLMLH